MRNAVLAALVLMATLIGADLARKSLTVTPLDVDHPPPWNKPWEARQKTGPTAEEVVESYGYRAADVIEP